MGLRELTDQEIAAVEARKAILRRLKERYMRGRIPRRRERGERFVWGESVPDDVIVAAFEERGL